MTEKEAYQSGYVKELFTDNKEEAKDFAKKIRKEYKCKTCVFIKPYGGKDYYSVFADKKHSEIKEMENLKREYLSIPKQIDQLTNEYNVEMSNIVAHQSRLREKIEEIYFKHYG